MVVNSQLQVLASLKLMVAQEKIQMVLPFSFLGFSFAKYISSPNLKFNAKDRYTLIELQQLCGAINWIKPILPVPELEIRHLFSLRAHGALQKRRQKLFYKNIYFLINIQVAEP